MSLPQLPCCLLSWMSNWEGLPPSTGHNFVDCQFFLNIFFNPLYSREVQEGESTLFLSYFPKESQGCRKFVNLYYFYSTKYRVRLTLMNGMGKVDNETRKKQTMTCRESATWRAESSLVSLIMIRRRFDIV